MSDFVDGFWSLYVAGITLVSIVACALLLTMQHKKARPGRGGRHHRPPVGRGPRRVQQPAAEVVDVALLDHDRLRARLPRPLSRARHLQGRRSGGPRPASTRPSRPAPTRTYGPVFQKYAAMDIEAIAKDPQGKAMGERMFLTYCSQCHGSDARGAKGFPNLADGDWLWGGEPQAILTSILDGRNGNMPPMGAAVGGPEGVKEVANYVLSLSGARARRQARGGRQGASSRPAPPATVPRPRAIPPSARPTSPTRSGCTAAASRRSPSRSTRGASTSCPPTRSSSVPSAPGSWPPTSGACRRRRPGRSDPHALAEPKTGAPAAPAIPLKVVASAAGARDEAEGALFEVRKKIYPRAVHGWFATLALGAGLVHAGHLLRPALARRGTTARRCSSTSPRASSTSSASSSGRRTSSTSRCCWSSAAVSLFLFTAVAGRLWCGYACPQTVYTEIFLWIERKIEGDRNARTKLDAAPLDARKVGLKAAKHGAWIALSLWTGFTFVGYFTPIRELGGRGARLLARAVGDLLDLLLRLRHLRQRRLDARAGLQVHVPLRALPGRDVRPGHADHRLRPRAGRPARRPRQEGRPEGARARRLRRLRHLRAGLPDRHRHPQRPAVRVHRLRRLHRRLRPGDGEDGLRRRGSSATRPRTRCRSTRGSRAS